MSFEENIILSIKREYSGNEKYRLLLRHLDNVENELRAERKKNTELIKQQKENLRLISTHNEELISLQERIDEYEGLGNPKKFISVKTHNKIVKEKQKFEKFYWELHTEYRELKEKLFNQNKISIRQFPDIRTSDDVNML